MTTFLEQIGGYPCLRRVHNLLYTKLFTHPWLKGFFSLTKREVVESQQTDFWASLMGGRRSRGYELLDLVAREGSSQYHPKTKAVWV